MNGIISTFVALIIATISGGFSTAECIILFVVIWILFDLEDLRRDHK